MPSLESLQLEEIEYLRWRGCFTLLPQPLQEALIKAYVHHCHSFESVLDPQELFDAYSKGQFSLLLLWAAIIALYRPFLHEIPDGVPDDEQDSWKALAKRKIWTAAAHATHAINSMLAEDLIKLAQTIAVLTISQPIQVHLLEMALSKSSSGKLAKHKLALCLLTLDEMRKYYVSADAAYKLFDHARMMVEKSLRNDDIDSQGSAPAADCFQEPQGIETSEWLDNFASMGYEVASVGLFSALWIPFANLTPDESLDGSS
ncbi:hypothetical protein FVEG_07754 [Fusarium verticillioides 7600]|uniref:Transcription factor domain-containing protein n=1 Tax=Gibberella moniliformis (strain M3125 / FGSC 7600) TaxID=334819 RepID=W7MT36_GIBM7|nr:hypothetical protein FVEG_07754 [Fusarium verticillioides 7600]EWG47702.1 hypothetical protein FVEG_07754 [Fusarium verticillioides 7600]